MSGYHLYRSSSLLTFPDRYPHLFTATNPLADPVYIIVQNAGLGQWLSRFLARKLGGIMGLRILMPEQALRKFALCFPLACRNLEGNAEKILFTDGLKLAIYKALEELLEKDVAFSSIRHYLEPDRTGRLWPLAEALASTFHHYGMNCDPLIDSWKNGSPHLAEEPIWQMHLWKRIFHSEAPYAHLGQLLSAIESSDEPYVGEKATLVLFGSTFLGEAGLKFFRKLSTFLTLHHFTLSPHADIKSPSQMFLVSNSRLSSGFNDLIPQLHPDSQEEHWVNPGPQGTTLHRLRASLINDEEFMSPPLDDDSLCFHDSPGIRRCIEILKDTILSALRKDDSLAPTQIGVLAPDISLYAPYIESVFPSLGDQGWPRADHLPYNITDLPLRDEAPFPSAVGGLLNLPGSRFGRGPLLQLIENPCFSPSVSDASLSEQWKTLIERLNIRWGVDRQHREEVGAADFSAGSWEQAFQRIISGYYHDEGDNPDIRPLPDVSDTLAEDAGHLMQAIMNLDRQIRPLHSKTKPLKDWTTLWEKILETWLTARLEDEEDRIRTKKALRDINALSDDMNDLSDFTDTRVSWPVFRSLFDEFRTNTGDTRGRYLARGITFGSLKPTRAIPFRRIYVLGLDEGVWPGRDSLPGFDLREKMPRVIDLSRESIDRFAFLEVLYSASDHLSLFYTGRDLKNGEMLSPSAPILELMNHLGEGSEKLIRHHRLLPYDLAVLIGEGPLATTLPETLALAEVRNHPSLPPPENNERVDWMNFVRFLKNPVRFFYHQRLGAELNIGDEVPDDYDILEPQMFHWWRYRDEAIKENIMALNNPAEFVQFFRRRSQLESAFSHNSLIEIQAAQWLEEAKALQHQLQRIMREGFCPDEPFTCRFGEFGINQQMASTASAGVIDLEPPKVALDNNRYLSITGTIEGLGLLHEENLPNRKIWTLVEFISRMTPSSTHNLRSWVATLILATALEEAPQEIRIFRVGKRDYKARRYYFREHQPPAGSGGVKVLLNHPHKILQRLALNYNQGQQLPLPLYPELADALQRTAKKNGIDAVPDTFLASWNTIISNGHAPYSAMRDCPWRQHFLPSPEFLESQAHQILTDLYIDGGIM